MHDDGDEHWCVHKNDSQAELFYDPSNLKLDYMLQLFDDTKNGQAVPYCIAAVLLH